LYSKNIKSEQNRIRFHILNSQQIAEARSDFVEKCYLLAELLIVDISVVPRQ